MVPPKVAYNVGLLSNAPLCPPLSHLPIPSSCFLSCFLNTLPTPTPKSLSQALLLNERQPEHSCFTTPWSPTRTLLDSAVPPRCSFRTEGLLPQLLSSYKDCLSWKELFHPRSLLPTSNDCLSSLTWDSPKGTPSFRSPQQVG